MFENKWYDRDSSLYFLQYKNIYMVTGVSIAWTMSTFTLKALSAVAVLKSKISIPPNQIPHTLNEDLRNLNTMCKLMREELEIMGKLKDVEKRSLIATFNCLLYVNMYEDLHTDDEEFRDFIYMKLQTYEMEVDECSSELKQIELEKEIRDGEEEMVLTKLPKEEFPEMYSLLELMKK